MGELQGIVDCMGASTGQYRLSGGCSWIHCQRSLVISPP
jgi:hypothetical protein